MSDYLGAYQHVYELRVDVAGFGNIKDFSAQIMRRIGPVMLREGFSVDRDPVILQGEALGPGMTPSILVAFHRHSNVDPAPVRGILELSIGEIAAAFEIPKNHHDVFFDRDDVGETAVDFERATKHLPSSGGGHDCENVD
ncbi:MAG: hypothetical protein HOO67_01025 [Candidatus Peribacteraceae bacterium]|nr:hypothetical protein [Candidatus Peribacteraceae bacterium]